MDRIPTRNELLYLLETNQIERLISIIRGLSSDVRNGLDVELKTKIGRALKEYTNKQEALDNTKEIQVNDIRQAQEESVEDFMADQEFIDVTPTYSSTPASESTSYEEVSTGAVVSSVEETVSEESIETLYDEEKDLQDLFRLCNSLGIVVNASSTSKNGTISPYVSFDLSRSFNPYYDNILASLHEEKNIDIRFSRKYQNEFDFLVKINKYDNASSIFNRLANIIKSTDVRVDYSENIPGDIENLKQIYLEDTVGSDFHQLIYTKLEDGKYAYLMNTDVDIYMDYATYKGFTECASGTNVYRTAQLISFNRDDASDKLDYIASNIRYANNMYSSMMAEHNNENIKEFSDVPFEQISNVYTALQSMDNGKSVTSIVIATPLDDKDKRVVKIFRPSSPTETRMQFKFNDTNNFDNEIVPKIVSVFANNNRTKTTIGVLADTPRAFYQAMSDYGDTLSFANMSNRSINGAKQKLNEVNRIYHHVQKDMITEYERMNVINGFLSSVLLPFMMAFTGVVTIAMIIKIILNS